MANWNKVIERKQRALERAQEQITRMDKMKCDIDRYRNLPLNLLRYEARYADYKAGVGHNPINDKDFLVKLGEITDYFREYIRPVTEKVPMGYESSELVGIGVEIMGLENKQGYRKINEDQYKAVMEFTPKNFSLPYLSRILRREINPAIKRCLEGLAKR